MSASKSEEAPLWIQDRNSVIAKSGDNVEWRYQEPPNYSRTNEFLKQGSQYNHLEGSLESIVQNLVRTFEMEATYKTNPQQWVSIVNEKFQMRTNGGPAYSASDIAKVGTYNLFLTETEYYNPEAEDFESSAHLFHNAFPKGFVWELIEVFSGPPNVTFKWRHWGEFSGAYKEHAPTGEIVEVVGLTVARVNDDLKIEALEHFFDTTLFLQKLTQGEKAAANGQSANGCPFHQ